MAYSYQYRVNRRALLRNNDVCWLCGQSGADSADHVVPVSLGGSDAMENLRPAHLECNKRRGNRAREDTKILRTSTVW